MPDLKKRTLSGNNSATKAIAVLRQKSKQTDKNNSDKRSPVPKRDTQKMKGK